MHAPFRIVLVLLVVTTAFSGCFGDDDAPIQKVEEDHAAEPEVTEETGSITGRILTKELDPIAKASVAAVAFDGKVAADTVTDAEGMFTLNGLAPATYRVQVSAICCKVAARSVDVKANEVAQADLQLERLTAQDLKIPYATVEEWEGFLTCGVGTEVATSAVCAVTDGTLVEDPNSDWLHMFNVTQGLEMIVVGVTWTPAGGLFGTDLWVNVEVPGCGFDCPTSETYGIANSPPNIVMRISDGPTGELGFGNISADGRDIQMRVFPGGDANVMYQQSFKVYWHAFYHEDAPEDFDPFPDG